MKDGAMLVVKYKGDIDAAGQVLKKMVSDRLTTNTYNGAPIRATDSPCLCAKWA